ncbi:hypothetical protein E4U42_000121 [Claviceps africana]|uniref:t-SNARE coiled-coil homology domain-containing protein n=1 Tax=Claviceps africana TaxID=83212 RepID=A0A8K0JGD3_9HYPO|nr:hypothetical protein E4U42_000121 [Claviceps africana]
MSYGQANPYYQGPAQEAGQGYGQENPYAQGQYEMRDYGDGAHPQGSPSQSRVLPLDQFLQRVKQLRSDIEALSSSVDYIGQLHQRTLASTDSQAKDQLEHYVSQTQIQTTAIKDGIKGLERDLAGTTDNHRNTKNTQLQSLKTYFKSELAKYQSVEHEYQQKYNQQIRRQYEIVYPDASEQEIQQAMEANYGAEGVFQMALKENRAGHATSLLGNVRARHNELQRIEQTLSELALLYQELATVVEQQEPVIQAAEENAQQTTDHLAQGNEQVKQATVSARRARKLKWWCLLIVVIIIIAVALGVGLGVCLTGNNCGRK